MNVRIYSFNSFLMEKTLIVSVWACGKLCGKKIENSLERAKIRGCALYKRGDTIQADIASSIVLFGDLVC